MALYKPKQLKRQPIEQNTETFVTNGAVDYQIQDLTVLSLDDLADRYAQIDQQSQLMKGLILLEARNRFPSNNEFGEWVKSVQTLCLDRQEIRTRYMNLAYFFQNKEIAGISITAAYEISAPANRQVADTVYEYVKGKNLKVADVRKKIKELKEQAGIPLLSDSAGKSGKLFFLSEDLKIYKDTVLDDIKSLSYQDAAGVLKCCLKEIQNKESNYSAYKKSAILTA